MRTDHAERQPDGSWIAYGRSELGETGYGDSEESALADLRRRRRDDAADQKREDEDEKLSRSDLS